MHVTYSVRAVSRVRGSWHQKASGIFESHSVSAFVLGWHMCNLMVRPACSFLTRISSPQENLGMPNDCPQGFQLIPLSRLLDLTEASHHICRVASNWAGHHQYTKSPGQQRHGTPSLIISNISNKCPLPLCNSNACEKSQDGKLCRGRQQNFTITAT